MRTYDPKSVIVTPGYVTLAPDEIIKDGDQWFNQGFWCPTTAQGETVRKMGHEYRRPTNP